VYLSYSRGFKTGGYNYPASGAFVTTENAASAAVRGLETDIDADPRAWGVDFKLRL
jgi:hypothetical protein